jgi:hypothetical protein
MTQKLSKRGAFLAASLVLGAAFAATSLSAQTVSTAPVGAVTTTIPTGLSAVGVTLLNPDLVVANCTGNTATALTLSGVSNVGSLLANTTPATPYYIEGISGPMEGDRFDVDTAATILAANSSVVITTAVGNNNTLSLTTNLAVASQFALRKHVTIRQVGDSLASKVANNNVNSADQIRLFNTTTGGFVNYYLRSTPAGEWRIQGGNTSSDNVVIPPGTGIMIFKRTSATTLVSTGGVRVNDFVFPMPQGLSFKALPYPISYSPATLVGSSLAFWTANNNIASADQLRTFSSVSGAFSDYYLRSTPAGEWRPRGGGTGSSVSATQLMSFDGAFLVSKRTNTFDYLIPSPLSL